MSCTFELAERFAFALSTRHIREAAMSLKAGKDDWVILPKEAHRTRPYPMGFYADDNNLYYAIGWGRHVYMWPWERWLLRRSAAVAQAEPPAEQSALNREGGK